MTSGPAAAPSAADLLAFLGLTVLSVPAGLLVAALNKREVLHERAAAQPPAQV